MRRILLVVGVSLTLHTLVFIVFDRYSELTLNLGALFVHGHDISDIPPVMGAGFALLAIIVIVAGGLVDRVLHFLLQRAARDGGGVPPSVPNRHCPRDQ